MPPADRPVRGCVAVLVQACVLCRARSSCRGMNPPLISKIPMMTNQIPSSTARTVSEEVGAATTTIPAIRLTAPKMIHQALPSRAPPEIPPISAASP